MKKKGKEPRGCLAHLSWQKKINFETSKELWECTECGAITTNPSQDADVWFAGEESPSKLVNEPAYVLGQLRGILDVKKGENIINRARHIMGHLDYQDRFINNGYDYDEIYKRLG